MGVMLFPSFVLGNIFWRGRRILCIAFSIFCVSYFFLSSFSFFFIFIFSSSPFGLNATKAIAPGVKLLTLTSSSTLHRPRCLRSQTSLDYIVTRLERHQGHSARSQVAHFDELIYSAQATLPQKSDQLRLHRHSATSPFGLNATKATTLGAKLLTLTSSSTQHRPRCLRSQTSSSYIATRLHRHSA